MIIVHLWPDEIYVGPFVNLYLKLDGILNKATLHLIKPLEPDACSYHGSWPLGLDEDDDPVIWLTTTCECDFFIIQIKSDVYGDKEIVLQNKDDNIIPTVPTPLQEIQKRRSKIYFVR